VNKTAQENSSTGNLVALNTWLASLGVTPITGWRWRRNGWIPIVNICGRVYVSRETIADFERRAQAGEFAKEHKAPSRNRRTTDGQVTT
jgi:hypothetical protein